MRPMSCGAALIPHALSSAPAPLNPFSPHLNPRPPLKDQRHLNREPPTNTFSGAPKGARSLVNRCGSMAVIRSAACPLRSPGNRHLIGLESECSLLGRITYHHPTMFVYELVTENLRETDDGGR